MTPCCSVTATPGTPAYYAHTVCTLHNVQGWSATPHGVDHLATNRCGCTSWTLAGRLATKCALHSIGSFACCTQATRLGCVCYEATTCHVHGERHTGTHD